MPTIFVNFVEGKTVDQKKELVRAITDAVVKTVNVKPEAVTIYINDVKKENLGIGGVLRSEKCNN